MDRLDQLITEQSGVISRRQLLALDCAPHDVKRMLRRRDLASIRTGVYVQHTGTPSWLEQAWAALLMVSAQETPTDVALAHWSAIRIEEGPGRRGDPEAPIHVVIPDHRRARAASGIVVHRTRRFDQRVHPGRWPQRIRYEEALLDVASQMPVLDGLGVLARAVGTRRSTAFRILATSRERPWMHRRAWLEAVLADIDQGTHSVLERGFLTEVLRPHGLPRPRLQQRERTEIGVVYRDAAYRAVLIELDGRLHHTGWANRDADLDRDLEAAATGRATVRLGWGQVFARPCHTAASLARVLRTHAQACGPACAAQECGRSGLLRRP